MRAFLTCDYRHLQDTYTTPAAKMGCRKDRNERPKSGCWRFTKTWLELMFERVTPPYRLGW